MEGQVLTLQEAQAIGVPVIGTYHDGIPEGVNEKVTGRLVPERDVGSLEDAIVYFLENPSTVREYSRATREYVSDNFDNEELTRELEEIYRDLLSSS
jgi:colanic acid/amylovoran biosynthesis glycosyltransferase